ncbi:ABC-2 type transport system ATP-binding protein [Jatrophihabitans endophyticus]|uniref:ABC-2 type transport system ATP-binding protein n=1 Tax=Jatrophihabitans endophyticus TaxID=1206085 RepID=A0A1M5R820_9ACTN|nr:ABC transporter ATP-binding protein [Jatrophihabitans endophyticus]SHH22230.1 ABC-2 type transport system ATP-binding protein [Jatrophihabitans endophyticus]
MTRSDAPSAGVALRGLHKSFRTPAGVVRAVRGLDLAVAPGETVALLGPNGAGKSTTIDMLLGLTRPDAGEVGLFGRPPAQAIAEGAVGAMLQTGGLIAFLSVRELLTMTGSFYTDPLPVDEVLQITGTLDVADRRTTKLSGGQTQRVRAAMALVSNPDLLVLDEPTVAMDVEGRHTFWEAVRAFARGGKTVLFATHYLEEADRYADRVVLMAQGRVVADGPANEIKAMVGGRTLRATLPGADLGALAALPGVTATDSRGDAVVLTCADSDAAVRALLGQYPQAKDIEISSAGLEAAFLALTGDPTDPATEEITA